MNGWVWVWVCFGLNLYLREVRKDRTEYARLIGKFQMYELTDFLVFVNQFI